MFPVLSVNLFALLVIFPLTWLRGGHPERTATILCLASMIVSRSMQYWRMDNFLWGIALSELLFLIGLIWLTLNKDRWWLLVATAFQILVLLIYLSPPLSGLAVRTAIAASYVPVSIVILAPLAGVVERWLAGEAPVSPSAVWHRRMRDPSKPLT